jgi:NADH:ubiquinone oxidoreductase subunit E
MNNGEKKEDENLKPLIQILEKIQKKLQEVDIKKMTENAQSMKDTNEEIDNHKFNTFIENFQKESMGDADLADLAKKLKISYLYINS